MSSIFYTLPRNIGELALDRAALIEASAGTGKTYTIEHLVARLLLETATPIDRILVVTFTEKATGELRARIRRALEKILRGEAVSHEADGNTVELNATQIENLRRALVAFDSAPIHTIHSFCHRVLSELAFGTGSRFGLELIDSRRAFHEAMRATLRDTFAVEDRPRDLLRRWLESDDRDIKKLESLLYQANEARLDMALATRTTASSEISEALIVSEFLPRIRDRLGTMKQERGVLDYSDMLSRVRDALAGASGPALISTLRKRYSHALIDEFQDTDDLQWDIFRRVFVESAGANPIFLIGDPKQAIYSFRGADIFAYLEARDQLKLGTARPHALVRNFRATSSMIDALNLLLNQSARVPFFTRELVDIGYDHPVECGKPLLGAVTESTVITPVILMRAATKRANAPRVRKLIGTFIAREIHTLLHDPKRAIEICDHDSPPKGLRADGIFILTRTLAESEEAGKYLRAHGVPFAFYKQEGLFQTAEASDVLDVLGAVADPSRRSNRLRAWASPFFGVSYPDLPRLVDLDAAHPLNDRLIEWQALADAEQFAELFDALLYRSGLADRELFLADSERELTNYQQIFEVLLEQASANRLSIVEVVELLDDYFHERAMPPGSDRNVQRLESERAAVQIMTIHKAKGLEADVVFLFGGFHAGNNNETQVWVYHEDGKRRVAVGRSERPAAKKFIDAEAADEERRLSYVAITRARARLYLPFFAEDTLLRPANGYYCHLNKRLAALGEVPIKNDRGEVLIDSVNIALPADQDAATPNAEVDPLASWQPPAALLDQSRDRVPTDLINSLRRKHRGFRIESYTSLERNEAGIRELEVEDFKRDAEVDAALRAEDLPGSANVGVFLHEVIEQLDFSSFDKNPIFEDWRSRVDIRELFERTMRLRQVVDPRWLARGQEIVFNALTAPIRIGNVTLTSGLRSCDESREMEFTFPIPEHAHPDFAAAARGEWRAERGFVTGYVDLIFRHSGLTYFADWKSDLLESYEAAELESVVRERYENQRLIYSIGVVRLIGIASEQEYEARFGGLLYVFIRGVNRAGGDRGIYFHRPSWNEVRGYVTQLGAALGGAAA